MNLPLAYTPRTYGDTEHPFIALEGPSGMGKSTLENLLTHRLQAMSLHTLPRPHNDWSKAANSHLAPLPQLCFYLSGLLHSSDCVRTARSATPVIADRYQSSVLACHAAAHGIPVEQVRQLAAPFLPYIVQPTHTFYLRCRTETLQARMRTKSDLKQDDTDLLTVPGRLDQVLFNFEAVASQDPSAIWIDTDDKTPDQVAHEILHTLERTRA
ncbi:thymidylate kinase [Streptomyces sp. NBC_01016]|uniref:dTMP kinase n=1 Tax=Streptomyces sp. NBC_01016 TaxID=2903720 RepID=UPI0022580F23|nr:thymidylate kinase [Streptomyces sp. NBC_01016]MCX4834206.1 thymidylate kinase [Streptomyces sp. NBC_01016]